MVMRGSGSDDFGGLIAASLTKRVAKTGASTRRTSSSGRDGSSTTGRTSSSRTSTTDSRESVSTSDVGLVGGAIVHYKSPFKYNRTLCGKKLKDVDYTLRKKNVTCKKCKKMLKNV